MLGFISSLGTVALDEAASLQASALVALFLIAVLTEVGIPFPFILDTTVLFVGYQAGFFSSKMLVLMVVLYLGGLVGSGLIYLLARFLGNPFVSFLEKRFTRLRTHVKNLSSALSSSRVPLAIAVGRLTPGLLIPVSIASGYVRLPFHLFALGLGLASLIIDVTLISAGLFTRRIVDSQLFGLSPTLVAFGVAILISIAWASQRLISRLRKRLAT